MTYSTNPQILTREDLDEIFNPTPLTPKEITEQRQTFSTAKEWESHVELNIPNVDPQEEYKIKIKENRKQNQKKCGQVRQGGWNLTTLNYKTTVWFCKQADCPKCQIRKKQQFAERLDNLSGSSIITLEPGQVQKFQASLSKADYIRIPRSDGKISFILNEACEGSEPFTYEIKEHLSEAFDELPSGKRITGNLGKILSCAVPQKKDEITQVIEEAENILDNAFNLDIKRYFHEIAYTSDSKLKSDNQIETEVLKRLNASELEYNISMLQWLIDKLEKITQQVCKDNNIEYKVLSVVSISVHPNDIKWDDFKERLLKAQFA